MSGPSASAPHPTTVGNTFVKQYYSLLTGFPEKLHRFYKDESTFSHGSGSQPEESVSGQTSINSTILKKNYNGAVVKLDHGSIDCQPSQAGGVIVLVTGVITLQNKQPEHFVQTFFLAVQENGYFVLNDVLRFLNVPTEKKPSSPKKVVSAAPSPSKATQTQTKENVPPTSTPSHAVTAEVKSPKNLSKAVASPPLPPSKAPPAAPVEIVTQVLSPKRAPVSPTKKPATPKAAVVAAPVVEEQQRPETPKKEEKVISPKGKHPKHTPKAKSVEEAPAPVDNGAPKSWATHLFAGPKKAPAVASETFKPAPASPVPATPSVVKSPTAKPTASWDDEPADEPTPAPAATTNPTKRITYFSLYVRDVPVQTTSIELRDVFKSYGKIASTNVLDGKGYAFVDFFDEESVNSVLATIKEGNQFLVHDQVLHVSLRTPRDSNKSGGGRGGRGNGNFTNGGRGGGRGPQHRTNYQAKDSTGPRINNATTTQQNRENKGRGRGNSAAGRGQNSAATN